MSPFPSEGKPAHAFDLERVEGGRANLDSLAEARGALLVFFKTECPTCQLTFPFLERLYCRLKDTELGFLAVGQNTTSELREFAAKYRITIPFASEPAPYTVSTQYDLVSVPTVFLVDAGKTVRKAYTGHSKQEIDTTLDLASRLAGTGLQTSLFSKQDAEIRDFQPG